MTSFLSTVCLRSYHDGEPKGLQLLNELDAQLQFSHPLKQAGVDNVIIWGDEEQSAGRTALLNWFKNHSDIFGGDVDILGPAATHVQRASDRQQYNGLADALKRPPIPRDGPIPEYTECGL